MVHKSREYAVALYSIAKENGQEKDIFDALRVMDSVFAENPEYIEFLSSPGIPAEERTGALETAFADSLPEYAVSFACVLCRRGGMREFSGCVKEYEQIYTAILNMTTARVTSAVPLSDAEKEKLHHKLEKVSGRAVTMQCAVDPSLIGGVIVEMDGKTIDGSLRRRVHEMKEVMDQ